MKIKGNMRIWMSILIMHLKELFNEASRTKRYEISMELLHCKMIEGSLVNTYALKIIIYIKTLSQLGFVMDCELSVDLVLHSLPPKLFRIYYELSHEQVGQYIVRIT